MKPLLFALLIVAFAGCRTEPTDTPEASGADAPSEFVISEPERAEGAEQTTREVTLTSATDGDNACYLMVDSDGETQLLMAEHALCESAPAMEGQRVQITQEAAEVIAESCQGDPKCPESETVPLVVAVEAAQ